MGNETYETYEQREIERLLNIIDILTQHNTQLVSYNGNLKRRLYLAEKARLAAIRETRRLTIQY